MSRNRSFDDRGKSVCKTPFFSLRSGNVRSQEHDDDLASMETPWTPPPRTAQVEAFLFANSQPQMNEDNSFDGRQKI
jgi:hypothetical protein